MKANLVGAVILVTASAFAQAQSPRAIDAACGPSDIQFEMETGKNQPLPEMEAGKSVVYVIEVFDRAANQISRPTLRVGLDGKWVGAGKGTSYINFTVEPGEHHLCVNWQSRWKHFSREAAFFGFTADPGKTYYFRARISEMGSAGAANFPLDLEPVNEDEGRYLVSISQPSVSRASHSTQATVEDPKAP
jgi:hypothetical protein